MTEQAKKTMPGADHLQTDYVPSEAPLNVEKPIGPFPFKKKDKVAIVGFAPSSMKLAPFSDETWEIWTLNNIYAAFDIPRWDRWFEMHKNFRKYPPHHENRVSVEAVVQGNERPVVKTIDHLEWLKGQQGKPIYFLQDEPDIPASVPYPIEEVKTWCQRHKWAIYFTNSISYMIALAIGENYNSIGIYGVDMAAAGEYEAERGSVEYWLGIAQTVGIDVVIPNESELLKAPLYGYHQDDPMVEKFKIRRHELFNNHNGAINQMNQARDSANYFKGAADDMDFVLSRLNQ